MPWTSTPTGAPRARCAVKIFGADLDVLESKAVEIRRVLDHTPGFSELTVVRELGQPSLTVTPNRAKIARYASMWTTWER